MKPAAHRLELSYPRSLPPRERELKPFFGHISIGYLPSLPPRERELKRGLGLVCALRGLPSLPPRERELKLAAAARAVSAPACRSPRGSVN